MQLTTAELRAACPQCPARVLEQYVEPLAQAMAEFFITTWRRRCFFLAQVSFESMQLRRTREIWTPTPAQIGYEHRVDLGNNQPGDGERYMGRGLLQVTGRANYQRCSRALYRDDRVLDRPDLLEQPQDAARSAGWFWALRNLNRFADRDDFDATTLRINGSLRTAPERQAVLDRIAQVLVA